MDNCPVRFTSYCVSTTWVVGSVPVLLTGAGDQRSGSDWFCLFSLHSNGGVTSSPYDISVKYS